MSYCNIILITALRYKLFFFFSPTRSLPSLVFTFTSLLPGLLKDILNSAQFFPETTLYALIIQENSVSPYLESSMSQSFSLIRTSRLRAIVFYTKLLEHTK